MVLWVLQWLWTLLQNFLGSNGKWGVHIQFKIGHDEQLVPQLMLKVGYVPQMGLQIAHYADDGLGLFIAFVPVRYGNGMVHHFLKMAAVFRNKKLWAFGVVF